MIYHFENADPSGKEFLAVLERNAIDFEQGVFDRTVVRILGVIKPEVREELERIYGRRSRAGRRRSPARTLYSEFTHRTEPIIIAGPCSVESEEQIAETAAFLESVGIRFIRGGAYKPRTSPDSFQGLGRSGLKLLSHHARKHGLKVVSEVMDRSQIGDLLEHADIIQVGSRNMFNYTLLTALGSVDKPILLKRGMAATIDEWISASDYCRRGGNDAIILCERGIRTFEPKTRNTLDISAICIAKKLSGYPVIADPSHATGDADLVLPVALAALSAGADGVMIEIHPKPEQALSDREQALSFSQFEHILRKIADHRLGRTQSPEMG
ncbi:MAG: 3-deoxy-7-phosphoheptulonate synthase [Candidatus Glassbacteria bacterium RBG_16_58_8]|uniref:3-deoxy-7-phosphoheptulonate synthase n=1 Tax=Candidatus Glassbacteria bacterium RBG_16_58_8 TaxID=1817866 RepID=A0A1F5YCQ4_9BACT|nr:MAG: 3-deoxy-7-phosphoheptulonate synthase [Candidatus Glassbacteria bacterium RBG_16_58_8]